MADKKITELSNLSGDDLALVDKFVVVDMSADETKSISVGDLNAIFIASIVDQAPQTLDTLNELAAALGDNPDFVTTVTEGIATKLPLAGGTITGNLDVDGNLLVGTNVGIGTVTPEELLHVKSRAGGSNTTWRSEGLVNVDSSGNAGINIGSGTTSTGNIIFGRSTDNSAGEIEYSHSDNSMSFWTASGERMRITSGGNVGIGTDVPTEKLDLTDPNGTRIAFSNTDTRRYSIGNDGLDFTVRDESAQVDRIRMDSGGSLLFNTTDPLLYSNGAGGNEGIGLHNAAYYQQARSGGTLQLLNRMDTSGSIVKYYYNGSVVGVVSTDGTSTSYNTTSDYRLKENVVTLDGAADRLKQIPVHRFNFISDPENTVDGFLAHELQAVVPEAVTGKKDAIDADGNPEYQNVDQSKLVPLLTAALQEALEKIEELEGRVAQLEGS